MEVKLYRCSHCGNIIIKIVDSNVPVMCCGAKMEEIVPGSVDAAVEKHVPVVEVADGFVTVSVGSVAHPMIPEHYISHVILDTTAGVQIASLNPGDEPKAVFALVKGAEIKACYAYCNLHGLWVSGK
ncbi:MAG: desulfoferrodoxin [Clostridiales bacterium]|nr:desulfoferrodoxin [Clostridiales bacterium]